MSEVFLVSVHGEDKPGTLNGLAKLTHQHQGKWLSSKVINLDGQFSSLIRIDVIASEEAALREALSNYPDVDIQFFAAQAELNQAKPMSFRVDAEDRPGLVNEITQVLMSLGASIKTMDCHRMQVPEAGTGVFSAELGINAPANLDKAVLVAQLQGIQESLMVSDS